MSRSIGRVFTRLVRVPLKRGIFQYNTTTVKLSSVRPLALSSQLETMSKNSPEEPSHEPLKFSTSKASHRTWKVDRSMGSQFERPWRKVLPLSLIFTAFLFWCALRGQSNIDENLDKPLHESLPGLRPEKEESDQKPS